MMSDHKIVYFLENSDHRNYDHKIVSLTEIIILKYVLQTFQKGRIDCEKQMCPTVQCHSPQTRPGQCCPAC